ncbi:MAG TPA: TetR/AcrR family transcriptional regulator [Spirochaetota bacterium]|nr:TetR/AcrR family transcriptional regulator [Spirochaetota bacterium]
MPRKPIFNKDEIIESSLKIVKEKGFKQLSAREIARELISSTRPVYEYFQSMEELKMAVLEKTLDLLYDYITRPYTRNPFLNTGVGYAIFARDHREYFRTIFLEDNDASGIIDELLKKLDTEILKVPELAKLSHSERDELLKRGWIYTHGFSVMVFSGYIKNNQDDQIIRALSEAGEIFIEDALQKHEKKK